VARITKANNGNDSLEQTVRSSHSFILLADFFSSQGS